LLKNHPIYSENWVQDIIAADPSFWAYENRVCNAMDAHVSRNWKEYLQQAA
jgi:hypothetical protein